MKYGAFLFWEKAHFCGHKCTLLAFGASGDNDWRNPDRPKDSEKGFLFHALLHVPKLLKSFGWSNLLNKQ